jgi:hypothetical protein
MGMSWRPNPINRPGTFIGTKERPTRVRIPPSIRTRVGHRLAHHTNRDGGAYLDRPRACDRVLTSGSSRAALRTVRAPPGTAPARARRRNRPALACPRPRSHPTLPGCPLALPVPRPERQPPRSSGASVRRSWLHPSGPFASRPRRRCPGNPTAPLRARHGTAAPMSSRSAVRPPGSRSVSYSP